MMRCGNCGHSNGHYGRHGHRYGYGSCGSAGMSDTEYDNASDDDDDDDDEWVETAVQPAPDRLRSQPVHDRTFPPRERYNYGPGPPSRQVVQPVQASLQFHGNNSFDSDSVCSGTFTLDLSTLQNIQNRHQQTRVAEQTVKFDGARNNRRSRPYTAMCVNDPEPAQYERDNEYRAPYAHPHTRQVANKHQPHFAGGRQFHERMAADDRRNYPPALRSQRNFAAEETALYEQFQTGRDYDGYDRNPYRYEPSSYHPARDGYRYQPHEFNSYAHYEHSTETDFHHARGEGYRRLPRIPNVFPDGERVEERGQMVRNVDDPAVYRTSAPGYSYGGSHFSGRYEESRPQMKGRYDHVPTRDIPASQMEYSERQQWHSGRVSQYRGQPPPSYRVARAGYVDQIGSRYGSVPARDDGDDRYPAPVSANDFDPASRQEPKDRWKQTRFQDVEPSVRPRGSATGLHESDLRSQASVQSGVNAVRETRDTPVKFPTPSLDSQQYYRSSTEYRGDARHGNYSSMPTKAPESSSISRSSIRGKYPDYPEEPDFPQDAPDEHRSSDCQDGRSVTGEMDKEETPDSEVHRASVPKNKEESPVLERRRVTRRVKFQSDPVLSHKEDSSPTLQSVSDSRRTSEGKAEYTSRVTSDGGQKSSDRRYQSAESLRSSNSRSRDQEEGEHLESGYSSQTSLLAQSRSASADRNRQIMQRTRSFDQVDRSDRAKVYLRDRTRSRESSRDRRRVLPRAPLAHRRSSDDEAGSSVIRDVATEIARMTSSVNSLDSDPPERPLLDSRSSIDRAKNLGVRSTSQTVTNSRLAMSTSDLDSYSSTTSAARIRERLQDQKQKKKEMRQKGLSGGEATLLAQIQDDLQSEIVRYTAELDAANPPVNRSVVCEEDPETSSAQTVNIVNTALIDNKVSVFLLLLLVVTSCGLVE